MAFFDQQGIFGVTGPYQGALGQLAPVTTVATATAPATSGTPLLKGRLIGMTPLPAAPTPLPQTMITVPGKIALKPGLIKVARRRSASVTRTQVVPLSLSQAPPAVQTMVQTARLAIPGVSPLSGSMPQIAFEERAGLWHVSTAAMPVLQQALAAMVLVGDPQSPSFDASASFVLSGGGGDAMNKVATYVDEQGYVALLSKASPATGSLQLAFTKDPAMVVAKASGTAATHAIILDRPDTVLAAAENAIAGGPPSALSTLPSWALPVGIGVVGLGAVALVLGRKKKG